MLLQFIKTFRDSTLRPSILLLRHNFPIFTYKNIIFISSRAIILLKVWITLLVVDSLNKWNRIVHRLCIMHISRLRRCEHLWKLICWSIISASNSARLFVGVGECCPGDIASLELFQVLNTFRTCCTSQTFHCKHGIIFIRLLRHYQFIKSFELFLKKFVFFIILSFISELILKLNYLFLQFKYIFF